VTILDELNAILQKQRPQQTQQTPEFQAPPQNSWVSDLIAQYQQPGTERIKRSPVGFQFKRDPFDPSSYYNQLGQIKNISAAATNVVKQEVAFKQAARQKAELDAQNAAVQNALRGINPQFTGGTVTPYTGNMSKHYKLKGVAPDVASAADYWGSRYGIRTIGGLGPGSVPGSDHPKGLALDFMINNIGNGHNTGNSLANDVIKNYKAWNVKYVIWNRYIWHPNRGWRPYHGPSAHTDHVHVSFNR
jgi:hypothetical protein